MMFFIVKSKSRTLYTVMLWFPLSLGRSCCYAYFLRKKYFVEIYLTFWTIMEWINAYIMPMLEPNYKRSLSM